MTVNDTQQLYRDTATLLSEEHAEAAAEIRQGIIALQETIASTGAAEKRSSLLARLFNGNA